MSQRPFLGATDQLARRGWGKGHVHATVDDRNASPTPRGPRRVGLPATHRSAGSPAAPIAATHDRRGTQLMTLFATVWPTRGVRY